MENARTALEAVGIVLTAVGVVGFAFVCWPLAAILGGAGLVGVSWRLGR